MDPQSLLAVEIGCWALAAAFGLAVLALRMRDAFQTDAQRQATRQWYASKWDTIQRTGLLHLPETAIDWLVRAKVRGVEAIESVRDWLAKRSLVGIVFFLSGASTVGGWIVFDAWSIGLAMALGLVPFLVCSCVQEWSTRVVPGRLWSPSLLLGVLVWLVGFTCWLKLFLTFSTSVATLVMLGVLPVFALGLGLVALGGAEVTDAVRAKDYSSERAEAAFALGLAMGLSFFVTLCSLLIGHAVRSEAPVPQTLQMLFSNVVCDGVTMLATVLILGAAVGPQRKFPIPLAILLDLALAMVLACGSLWCGLLRTENALSVTQVARVLIGQSPAGTQFQFGPYFWAMHTTFLPTLLYLSLIALCWLAKLVVLPLALVLQKGRVVEKPHHASAVTLLLVAAIFAALGKGLGYLRSYVTLPGS